MFLASLPRRAMIASLIRAGDRVARDPLDSLDQRPAQQPRALLGDMSPGYLGV